MKASSELVAQQIAQARASIPVGPTVLHGFAARRFPIPRLFASMLISVPWALAAGMASAALGVDTASPLFFAVYMVPAVAIVQLAERHTRHAVGICDDGSLVVARYLPLIWHRRPCKGIIATVGRRSSIEIEQSQSWWRSRRIDIDGRTWHLNTTGPDVEFADFEQWVERRQAPQHSVTS